MSIDNQEKLIYLASPYTDSDAAVMQHRYEQACRAAADLMGAGYVVYSPIAHSHPIAQHGLPLDHEFWMRQCLTMLDRCDRLIVLCIDGWQSSRGVHAEIEFAKKKGMDIQYLSIYVAKNRHYT